MPCIQLSTNKKMSGEKQKALKERFGKAIEIIPGKSEKWLMCVFCPVDSMWFRGEEDELAFLDIGIFGQLEKEDCDKFTKELMRIISVELEMKQEHIYIKYSATPYWGWNGKNL